jgi:hypothetical protein
METEILEVLNNIETIVWGVRWMLLAIVLIIAFK